MFIEKQFLNKLVSTRQGYSNSINREEKPMSDLDDTTSTIYFTDEDETLVFNYTDDDFLTTNYSQETWEDSVAGFRTNS